MCFLVWEMTLDERLWMLKCFGTQNKKLLTCTCLLSTRLEVFFEARILCLGSLQQKKIYDSVMKVNLDSLYCCLWFSMDLMVNMPTWEHVSQWNHFNHENYWLPVLKWRFISKQGLVGVFFFQSTKTMEPKFETMPIFIFEVLNYNNQQIL